MSASGRWGAAILVLAATGCGIQPGGFQSKSFQGQVPPELSTTSGRWINADAPPSLESLHGRVVWLEFSFLH